MINSNHFGGWFCGPGSFFSGFPFGGVLHLVLWGLVFFFLYKLARTIMASNKSVCYSESLTILENDMPLGRSIRKNILNVKKIWAINS